MNSKDYDAGVQSSFQLVHLCPKSTTKTPKQDAKSTGNNNYHILFKLNMKFTRQCQ